MSEQPRRQHPLEVHPSQRPSGPQEPPIVTIVQSYTPYLTYGLLAVNVAIFAVGFLFPDLHSLFIRHGGLLPVAVYELGHGYRLFTFMFLHGDITHMVFNGVALYVVGTFVEQRYGRVNYAVLYLFGGLGSALAIVALGEAETFTVGASGALFALIAARILYFVRNYARLGVRVVDQLKSEAFFLVGNIMLGVFVPRISNLGHMGGLAFGLLIALMLVPVVRQADKDRIEAYKDRDVVLLQAKPVDATVTQRIGFICVVASVVLFAGVGVVLF